MKIRIFIATALIGLTSAAFAGDEGKEEHFDVEFGYEDGMLIFEYDGPAGIDAAGVFEAEFEIFDSVTGTWTAEDPGFASNFTEGDEMFSVSNGDSFFLNVSQSQTFGSFLTYFNPNTQAFEATDATLTIEDNSPEVTEDLVVSGNGVSGSDLLQYITTAMNDEEIDDHVDFILSAGAADGAYGLLLNMESDNLSGDLDNPQSELFWVVLNNGIEDEAVFDAAVSRFTTSPIPEPSSAIVIGLVAVGLLRRRTR